MLEGRLVQHIESRVCLWQRRDALVCDGDAIALLRDNVRHFLEQDRPSTRFVNLHALADVTRCAGPVRLHAEPFRGELLAAWEGVWRVPLRQALPRGKSARRALPDASTLGELIANLVHELSSLSARSLGGEYVYAATPQMLGDGSLLRAARTVSLGPSRPFRH